MYLENLEEQTFENDNFRKVVHTGVHSQLVLMSLKPGEEIGMEVHPHVDQFFRIEQGTAKAVLDGKEYTLKENYALVVDAGTQHNIINSSDSVDLRLYTIYSPPNHPEGTVHKTLAEAQEYEKEHHH